MKIRGLLIASVVFAALAGILYWSDHRKTSAEAAKPDADAAPQILKLDQNSITKIELKKKDAPAILLTKTGSDWKITEPKPFAADQASVSSIVSKLASLDSERLVDGKATDLQRYGLQQPSLELDVAEKDNKNQSLLLGDDTPTGNAVYAALAGDPRVFTIASYNKTALDKNLNDLRDKRLLTVNPNEISRLEIAAKNGDIEFGRNQSGHSQAGHNQSGHNEDEWQIVKPKLMRADSYAVSGLLSKLTDARIDLGTSDKTATESDSAFAHATPVATVKVTGESATEQLQIRKSKDLYYAQSNVVEGAYKVGSDLGDAVNKSVDEFRDKKLFDFGYAEPNKLEIHSGAKTYSLLRGGQNWWDNGKKMDADGMQSLISNLRDLSAEKFVDSGFTTPEVNATVTSADGKRVEKVLISQSGANYVAKRENDPTLYELPANSVEDLKKSLDKLTVAPPSSQSGK